MSSLSPESGVSDQDVCIIVIIKHHSGDNFIILGYQPPSNIWSPNIWWRGTDGRVTKSIFRYKEFISLSKHENIFQYGARLRLGSIFSLSTYFLCDFVSDVRTERSNYTQSCVTHCHTCRVTEASCHDKNVTHVNLWRLVRENGIRIHPALAELSDTRAPGLGPPATDQQMRSGEPMLQVGLPVHLS